MSMRKKYGGVQKMEYIRIENSWQERMNQGDIDGALQSIQLQIATNLIEVHNRFCTTKLTSLVDVFGYETYGKGCSENFVNDMDKFKRINYKFNEASHGLDFDSVEAREAVLGNFQDIEKTLMEEMSKI